VTAFNILRYRVRSGKNGAFEAAFRETGLSPAGLVRASLVKTASIGYSLVGEWNTLAAFNAARPVIAAAVEGQRPYLEDIGGGLGATYEDAGEVVYQRKPSAEAEIAEPRTDARPARNIVRLRAKPDYDSRFRDLFGAVVDEVVAGKPVGFRRVSVINIGRRNYCIVGEWSSFDHFASARPLLLKNFDQTRQWVEDIGGMGPTFAVSGEVVLDLPGAP
jgi:hypothetical protein